jgi:hypothetical protein
MPVIRRADFLMPFVPLCSASQSADHQLQNDGFRHRRSARYLYLSSQRCVLTRGLLGTYIYSVIGYARTNAVNDRERKCAMAIEQRRELGMDLPRKGPPPG